MPDLFPETLLVSRSGEHIYTTSRKVAEHFGKRHDNVLRDVQKLLAGLPRAATAQRLGKSVGAVSYHRSQGRGLGLLPAVAVRRMAAPDA